MNTKHTPGPWIMATVPSSVGSCHKIGPFPSSGNRPYTYACVYADGVRIGVDEDNPAAIELQANARLIASAPDLLEALVDAVETIKAMSGKDLSCDPQEDVSEFEAVIAKATGANQNG